MWEEHHGPVVAGDFVYGSMTGPAAVYKVRTDGSNFRILHAWTAADASASDDPIVDKVLVDGDTIYGVTLTGGANYGGAVYKMDTEGGGYTELHSFTLEEERAPQGRLVLSGTTLYGMTMDISSPQDPGTFPAGTVFKLNTDGTGYAVLHRFTGGDAGLDPGYGLTLDGSMLYGTNRPASHYTVTDLSIVFKIDTVTGAFTMLHTFPLVEVSDSVPVVVGGEVYGTTHINESTPGSFYRIALDGSYSVLRPIQHWGYPERLAVIGSSFFGCDSDAGLFKIWNSGSQEESVPDPSPIYPFSTIQCVGELGASGTTLFGISSYGGGSTDPPGYWLFKFDETAYSVRAGLEVDGGAGSNGTIACAPSDFVPSGGSSTCTIQPLAGYAIRRLTDNGADVRANVQNGSYVIANIQEDHAVVVGFGVVNGAACSASTSCASGSCSDGVCCDRACDGQCEACSVPGQEGTCASVSGPPRGGRAACAASDKCHAAGTCDLATGACSNPVAVTCTASDKCHAAGTCDPSTGACSNPVAVTCTALDACHGVGTCDPSTGACSNPVAVTCPASDKCHGAGVCDPSTGGCSNPVAVTCTALDACHGAGTCDPSTGACSNPVAVTCSASDKCHGAGVCDPSTGGCSNPVAVTCTALDACHAVGTCDPSTGACSNPVAVTCTALDACHGAGTCDPSTGACSNPVTVTCSASDACHGAGTCDPSTGACSNPVAVTCSPLDECHVAGTCAAASGVCSNPNQADGTPCSGDAGTCETGVCVLLDTVDGGAEGGSDGSVESGLDGGDAAVDAGEEAGEDGGGDRGADSSMDAGPDADAGTDSGTTTDSGHVDGSVGDDSGTDVDSGTGDDSGTGPTPDDSGVAQTDAGDTADGGDGGVQNNGGCGCKVAQSGSSNDRFAFTGFGVLGLIATARRRRRRA